MTRVLSIRNRQHVRPINAPLLRRIIRELLREDLEIQTYELGVHLVDAEEMATINETFLEHHGSTDVITFDHAGYLKLEPPTSGQRPAARHLYGEIFLSVPDAIRHAKEFNTTWQSEVTRYVIHGLLHLTGHDDLNPAARRIMKREENKLVTRITSVIPVTGLGRPAKRKLGRRSRPA